MNSTASGTADRGHCVQGSRASRARERSPTTDFSASGTKSPLSCCFRSSSSKRATRRPCAAWKSSVSAREPHRTGQRTHRPPPLVFFNGHLQSGTQVLQLTRDSPHGRRSPRSTVGKRAMAATRVASENAASARAEVPTYRPVRRLTSAKTLASRASTRATSASAMSRRRAQFSASRASALFKPSPAVAEDSESCLVDTPFPLLAAAAGPGFTSAMPPVTGDSGTRFAAAARGARGARGAPASLTSGPPSLLKSVVSVSGAVTARSSGAGDGVSTDPRSDALPSECDLMRLGQRVGNFCNSM